MRHERAYSMMMVIVTTLILMTMTLMLLSVISAGIDTQRGRTRQHAAFYRCDGLGRALRRLVVDAIAEDPTTDPLQVLCSNGLLGGCVPAPALLTAPGTADGFLPTLEPTMQVSDLSITTSSEPAAISTGPLVGLAGAVGTVAIDLTARSRLTGVSCRARQTLSVATVPLTSFGLFVATTPYVWRGLNNTPVLAADFAVHANGDLEFGGYAVSRISATGALTAGGAPAMILTTPATTFTTTANPAYPNRALDQTQALPPFGPRLTVPASMQIGTTTLGGPAPNEELGPNGVRNTMRYLVDPVLPDDEPEVAVHKLAQRASIRIIDGSWYARPPDGSWPGTLLWSDHPSVPSTPLSSLEGTPAQPSQGNRYSYYRVAGARTSLEPPAVVSYGSLARHPPSGDLRPAFLAGNACGIASSALPPSLQLVAPGPSFGCGLERASRSTLVDLQTVTFPAGTSGARRIYPLNFDVAAFGAALASLDAGELGKRLSELPGHGFNGIIYITSSWVTGGTPSIGEAAAGRPPPQGPLPAEVTHAPRPRCVSDCAVAGPDVVRVVNAASLAAFPRGLTIATNLPMLVQGPVNDGTAPLMLAADTITLLSTSFDDAVAVNAGGASITLPTSTRPERSSAETYRFSAIVGQAKGSPGRPNLGHDGALRVWERWLSRPTLRGALIVGFYPVYDQREVPAASVVNGSPGHDLRPGLELIWDQTLGIPGRSPPGVPVAQQVRARSWEQ